MLKQSELFFLVVSLIDTLKPEHKSVFKATSSQHTNKGVHNYENISMLLSGQNVRIFMGINSCTLNLKI